jgi:hypothetical protein
MRSRDGVHGNASLRIRSKVTAALRETLQRAHAELARLAGLKPVAASSELVKTGQTFRQKWVALDVPGRN